MGGLRWRIILILIVLICGLVYVFPSIPQVRDSSLREKLPDDQINLGLDLKGGIHLTLGVGVEEAVENALAQNGRDIRSLAREQDVFVLRPDVKDSDTLQFTLLKEDKQKILDGLLADDFPELEVTAKNREGEGKIRYSLKYTQEALKELQSMTIDQAVKTIRNRIDQFGVAEPDIRKKEDNRIQVQLPGLEDPGRAIEIIGKTAHLEFKIVNEEADIQKAEQGIVPPDSELVHMDSKEGDKGKPLILYKEAVMTGENISNARVAFDSYGQPYVSLSFNRRGAKRFERITEENVKKRMAIVLDGNVHSAPVIQEKIVGGKASISGQFTAEEAHDLAIVLRAGSLPAPVKIMEERSVGPSLGQESIDKGIFSALFGGALVLIIMVLFYGMAGLVADVALVFNIVLVMAALALFGATLTLPGIAGIILTIGMAVDANVLIFERIREELRRGLSSRMAVSEGFGRATLTILDANVTTIIAAIILYQFGTGPVRGFAVTLTLGILASMFTAIFVSRTVFDIWLKRRKAGSTLSI
ncbi:MAG: protein translocase subunit SecD [Desulfonatronovibrionaceae bacterium]